MRPNQSTRLSKMIDSRILAVSRLSDQRQAINLARGICDLPVNPSLVTAAKHALDEGRHVYSYTEGIPQLRREIGKKLARDNKIKVDPDHEIIVTPGSCAGYASVIHGLLDHGDGILIPQPYYGYHVNTALLAGVEPHIVPWEPSRFGLDESTLRAALRPNSRALLLCTPSNPSGRVLSAADLETVAAFAKAHDLIVITDEIYEYLVYAGQQHISPGSYEELFERTVSIMGLSKTFHITGWRLGYVAGPATLLKSVKEACELLYICAPTPLQYGALAAFSQPPSYYDELRTCYQRKRDMLCDVLAARGLDPIVPEGGYFVLANIGGRGFTSSWDAARHLIERAGVAAVPGTDFFTDGEGEHWLRFCFARSDATLQQACERLAEVKL